jgi:cell division protein FtsI (penicillin-binding protein 3)
MEKTQALNGTVVVQDVHTGQILALAIRPTFNPNQFRHTTPELLRDHAVSDVYEPGSTFKLVTYSTALDEHVATPDDMIDCQGGQITIAGRVIHDDKSDRGLGTVSVATALARSSDVAAVKLALKVGSDHFYQYIRAFGFGSRTGIELPGETRGLLRPVNRWSGSSIGSLAIGQEVAVTPVQLVTMVSTIANGGVYLPPHILMPDAPAPPDPKSTDPKSTDPNLKAVAQPEQVVAHPFKAGEDLPNPLPPGAHRVISTMTAAEMRKMMEGVVLFGTGRSAQLNGYSSGGKTGTAQKIDPKTHTYSKTKHVASFAGFAPVNDPVISVAVVMDEPKGAYYGAEVSAPVFAEVAQQVLEYLGVQHDVDLRPAKPAGKGKPIVEDEADSGNENIQALYEAANDLPGDDPQSANAQPAAAVAQNTSAPNGTPAKSPDVAAQTPPTQPQGNPSSTPALAQLAQNTPPPQPMGKSVTISEAKQLRVPSLVGLSMRDVIVQAAVAGLDVEIAGSGTAREQAPAAGTMVAEGTKIVVKCSR